MRRLTATGCLGAALAALLAPAPAAAHVGPSPDVNNRYLKLSPLADGIRLVYTIYLGEQPGRALRSRIDRDRDGRLSPTEAEAFGAELGAEVAGGLALEVDGAAAALRWHAIDVGLGAPTTAAGSFAVDLVAWACFDGPPGGRHRAVLRDRFVLPVPGESELVVEESPGVRVRRAGLGDAGARDLTLRWRGAAQLTAATGYQLEVDIDPALASAGGVCGRPPPGAETPTARRWWLAGLLGVVIAALLAATVRYRKTNG